MIKVEVLFGVDVSVPFLAAPGKLAAYARGVFSRNGLKRGECNIVFIDDVYMAELNRTCKGRTGTTDVLSFDLTDGLGGGFCGEVYVSVNRAKAQAEEQGVPFDEELIRLVTHGLLHLAGFVHDTEDAHAAMTVKTEELVKSFFSERDAG